MENGLTKNSTQTVDERQFLSKLGDPFSPVKSDREKTKVRANLHTRTTQIGVRCLAEPVPGMTADSAVWILPRDAGGKAQGDEEEEECVGSETRARPGG